MFASRRFSNLADSNPDLPPPPFPNLDNSGNIASFNNLNYNFFGNSQQFFAPADMLDDQQKMEADEPRQQTPVKNLF